MDNIGQYFKDGIKKVSEAAMDAVVTSIVANQEQHLHHLQDIQQWGIIKLIQRWTTSKYLHQRPSVIPFHGFSLISLLYKKKLKNVASEGTEKNEDTFTKRSLYDRMFNTLLQKQLTLQAPLFSRSIGKISLNVKDCFFVLLGNPLNSRLSVMKTFQWRIIATYGEEKKETISARMVQMSQQEIISSLLVTSQSESVDFALDEEVYNTICWNHVIEFHHVKDLWSDICLSLMWRQTVENDKLTLSENSFTSEDIASSDAGDTSFKRSEIQATSGAAHSSETPPNNSDKTLKMLGIKTTNKGKKDNSINNPLLLLEETNPSKKRKAGTEWTLYGRAIIPLSSILCEDSSFLFDRKHVKINEHKETMKQCRLKHDEKNVRQSDEHDVKEEIKDSQLFSSHRNGRCEWCCSTNLLLNLYPHNKKELKYYRPMPGYTALGMQNPQLTLGFLRLNIQFKSDMSRRKAVLLSMLNSPNSRWINSYSFEPQYLEAYGQRAKHCITSFPRWVSKFLHLFSSGKKPKRNIFDKFFVALFWIQILGGFLCLPIYYLPLCFLGTILCVSLSYRLGNHSTVPCSFSLIYKDNCLHKCDTFRNCHSTIKSMRNCCHGNRHKGQLIQRGCHANSAKGDMLKTYETKKEMLDGTVLCKSNDEALNPEFIVKKPNECKNGLFLTAQKVQGLFENVDSELSIKRLSEGSNILSNFEEHFHSHNAGMSENSTLNDFCIKRNGEWIEIDSVDRTHSIKPTNPFKIQQIDSQSPNSYTEQSCEQIDKENGKVLSKNVSLMDSPIGTLVSSVCDSTSYCSQYPIFSDDVENQNVHHLLDEGLDLLDAAQRVAGISSSIIEKLKFAFNWEDPLITEVSLVVAALVTLQLTLLIFIFMNLPRWIIRLPLLSPLFFFIILTDPFIQQKLWLETFGIDVVMIYSALLSRNALQVQKKKTRHILSRNPYKMQRQSEGKEKVGEIQDKKTKDSGYVLTVTNEEPKVDCKINDTNTDGTALKTWMGLRNRWRNVMNTGQKVNLKLQTKPKSSCQQNLADFEFSQEKVYQKCHGSETRQWHETDVCPGDNVSVLSVSANVVTLLQENHGCRCHMLKRFINLNAILSFLQLILLQGPFLLVKRLFVILTMPLRSILFFSFLLLLHAMDLMFRFLLFWWIRLPDRREIEHRQIAASQRVSFFKNTMPLLSLKPSCTFKSIGTKRSLPRDNQDIHVGRTTSNDSGYDQPCFFNVNESKIFTFKETNLCSPKTVSSLIKTNLMKMVSPNSNASKCIMDKSIHEELNVKVDDVASDATNPFQSQDNSNINKEFVALNSNPEVLKDDDTKLIENLNEPTHKSISQFLKKESPNLLSYREDASFSNTINIIKKALPFYTGVQKSSKNVYPVKHRKHALHDSDTKHFESDIQSITSSSSKHSLKHCSFTSLQGTLFEDKANNYLEESDGSLGKESFLTESLCQTPQHEERELVHTVEEACAAFKPAGRY